MAVTARLQVVDKIVLNLLILFLFFTLPYYL